MCSRATWQWWRWARGGFDMPNGYSDGLLLMLLVFAAHESQRWLKTKENILARPRVWAATCTSMFVYILMYGIKGPEFIYFQF